MTALGCLAQSPRPSRIRRGGLGQRERRALERTVRRAAVAFARWAARLGLSGHQAADCLQIPSRTLARWRRAWQRTWLRPHVRGRPCHRSNRAVRQRLLALLGLLGPGVGLCRERRLFFARPLRVSTCGMAKAISARMQAACSSRRRSLTSARRAAVAASAATARPWGYHGPTPDHAWARRRRLTAAERSRFAAVVRQMEWEERLSRGIEVKPVGRTRPSGRASSCPNPRSGEIRASRVYEQAGRPSL